MAPLKATLLAAGLATCSAFVAPAAFSRPKPVARTPEAQLVAPGSGRWVAIGGIGAAAAAIYQTKKLKDSNDELATVQEALASVNANLAAATKAKAAAQEDDAMDGDTDGFPE